MATASNSITVNEVIDSCKVFISYQWNYQEKVIKLYEALSCYDTIKPFMDIYTITAGMKLYQTLAKNIENCDVLVACITPDYIKSKNCEREIIYADNFNKTIIPIYFEDVTVTGSIGFILIRERYCKLNNIDFNVIDNLINSNEFKDILNGIENSLKLKVGE